MRKPGRARRGGRRRARLFRLRSKRPSDTIETIAVIDGAPVALASFRVYFEANAGRPIAESRPAVVSGLFDQFLREETWRREAPSSGDENTQRRDAPAVPPRARAI
jgi:hypothetical protein